MKTFEKEYSKSQRKLERKLAKLEDMERRFNLDENSPVYYENFSNKYAKLNRKVMRNYARLLTLSRQMKYSSMLSN